MSYSSSLGGSVSELGRKFIYIKFEYIWIVRCFLHECVAGRRDNNYTQVYVSVAVRWCAMSNVHRKYQKKVKFSLVSRAHTRTPANEVVL